MVKLLNEMTTRDIISAEDLNALKDSLKLHKDVKFNDEELLKDRSK